MDRKPLFVAMPAGDKQVHLKTVESLMQLTGRFSLTTAFLGGGCYLTHIRNLLATHFMRTNIEDMLFVDSDVSFDAAQVERMVNREQPIVGGAYCWKRVREARLVARRLEDEPEREGDLERMAWIGTGLMRIKRHVFETLRDTGRAQEVLDEATGDRVWNWFPTYYAPSGFWTGEDVGFCELARKAGFPIYLDLAARGVHHGFAGFPLPHQLEELKDQCSE